MLMIALAQRFMSATKSSKRSSWRSRIDTQTQALQTTIYRLTTSTSAPSPTTTKIARPISRQRRLSVIWYKYGATQRRKTLKNFIKSLKTIENFTRSKKISKIYYVRLDLAIQSRGVKHGHDAYSCSYLAWCAKLRLII